MNPEEIYKAITQLAKSQGYYGDILEHINNEPKLLEVLSEKNFKDIVDLVMYLEG